MQSGTQEGGQRELKSRAEVQLLSALQQKKAKSASGYLREEQQRVEEEETQEQARLNPRNLQQYRIGNGKNAPPPSEQEEMIMAVRQLEQHVVPSKREPHDEEEDDGDDHNQIERNAIRRRETHMAAQREYTESVKTISEDIEVALIHSADKIKATLAAIDGQLDQKASELMDEKLLLRCAHGEVLTMWTQIEQLCGHRTATVEAFGEELEGIECTRIERVSRGLTKLTKTLMDTAHALPPEVERIIENEAYEVNVVVTTNRRVYADLIARMATQDVDVFVRSRLQWEDGQTRWRRLRHDDAIQKFHETIGSTQFTDPSERREVIDQLRAFQERVHNENRLIALQKLRDAKAELTSVQTQDVITQLNEIQRDEEDTNAQYFKELRRLHDEKVHQAQQLRESLRLELHGFGALAPEGDIVSSRDKLAELLRDESLEEFFRVCGGLRTELDSIVKRLNVSELIYQPNLTPLRSCVDVLLSALPLEAVMENQGKGAERKAVQTTLDKMRKAAKHEIISLLPALQTQVVMLLNLADTSDVFKAEVEDVGLQLRVILEEYEAAQDAMNAVAEDANDSVSSPGKSRSGASTGSTSPPASPGKTSASSSGFLTINGGDAATAAVDLQAIRKVQRRLGTLVYATELSPAFHEQLKYIAQQLELQAAADGAVDAVITGACEEHLAAREEESTLFLKDIGHSIEHQSGVLHDQCERLAKFFLRVAQTMEQSEDRVRFVNLSTMDLLDTLKENDEDANTELENKYTASCARLRHAADSDVLQDEFARATDLLHQMEESYRLYQRRVTLAATNHVVATQKQRDRFLFHLCALFGLVSPSALETFDLEHFLSVEYIDDITTPKKVETELETGDQQPTGESSEQSGAGHAQAQPAAAAAAAKTASPRQDAVPTKEKPPASGPKSKKSKQHDDAKDVEPPKPRFQTPSGLELEITLKVEELVVRILTERSADEAEDDDVGRQSPASETTSTAPQVAAVAAAAAADAMPADAHPEPEVSAEEIAKREAHEARLHGVKAQVVRDFLVLEVETTLKEALLDGFRDCILTKFDVTFKAHLASAAETQAQRQHDCNFLLEERLRMHWPRKGRLDVQIYQPRIGELYSHRQRFDRHTRSMTKKIESQQGAFNKLVTELETSLEDVRLKQLTFQAQLPLQQSLAALQGLEVKSKKLLSACRVESEDKLQKLRTMTTNDATMLSSLTQDYVRMCSAQIFPDLSSCEVIAGCDYHPEEVAIVQAKLQAVEATLRDTLGSREAPVQSLVDAQQKVLGAAQEFKTRYQACLQSLSMKEGLGQKYGLPRRTAQERYRSETTRADELSAKIDELLASLQSVVESKRVVKGSRLPEDDVSTQVLHLLLRLRAKVFYRGVYFGFLKNVSQLEPVAVSFDAGGVHNRPVFKDTDTVEEEYRAPPTVSFLDFVKQVGTKCREDTRQLYQQEGKLDDLPPSGVPVALEAYVTSLSEKARAYVIQQELKFRDQVDFFGELLALAPETALSDLVERARTKTSRASTDLHEELVSQFDQWMELKNRNTVDLRPDLCSPNNAAQLQALCEREASRSVQTVAGIRACRSRLFEMLTTASTDFERELLAVVKVCTVVLDTSVMTLDDLKPFSGEELPKSKRKSLKRLRKLARIQEIGDPREVKRSDDEMKKLMQLNEAPRFPRRAWPAIPSFGLHSVWEAKRAELVKDDEEMRASVDPEISGLTITKAAEEDGACVALLTHAHRCLIHSRDEVYATYVAFVAAQGEKLLSDLQERLRDEIKWTESWQLGIDKVKQQARPVKSTVNSTQE